MDNVSDMPHGDPVVLTADRNLFLDEIVLAYESLTGEHQVVLKLVVEGLTYAEVASFLGVPVGTVMSRLSRARQAIGAKHGEHDISGARRLCPGSRTSTTSTDQIESARCFQS
jgi:RNA polymerase sigma-70 factor, ECF subfamily